MDHSRTVFGGIVTALAFIIGSATHTTAADTSLLNNSAVISGPIQVRLSFTDQNGVSQDLSLLDLPPAVANLLPPSLQQQAKSPLLLAPGKGSGYFDQLWQGIRNDVCGEIAGEIGQQVNNSNNRAHDISCTPDQPGALLATVQSQWTDPFGFRVSGTQLVLDYWIPYNESLFSVTSPTSCKEGNLVCGADPQMTLLFDTHIIIISTSLNVPSLSPPPNDSHAGSTVLQGLYMGNEGDAVRSATNQWGAGLGIGAVVAGIGGPIGEAIGAADLITQTLQFAAQLAGIAAAVTGNAGLPDTISNELQLSSPSAASAAIDASGKFDLLYQGMAAAQSIGFSKLDVTAGADRSLIFRLTSPPAVKPALHNVIAEENSTPSLFQPSIGLSAPDTKAGGQITVRGNFFKGSASTRIIVNWDHTVPTEAATSEVDWELEGGTAQHVSTTQGSFEADNLTPGKNYQFKVHECNPLTCAPWSDTLTATTAASGTDQVVVWLDNAASTAIGRATVDGNGSFSAIVTIPVGTAPGQHTLHASLGQPSQTAPIMIFPPLLLSGTTQGNSLTKTNLQATTMIATPVARTNPLTRPDAPIASVVITPVGAPIKPLPIQNPVIGNTPIQTAAPSAQQATTTIMVCGDSGCVPTIALINRNTNTVQPAPGQVEDTMPFTLRGDSFLPGQPVTVFVDSPTGTKIGSATAGANGSFQTSFTMPSVSGGNHQFVAVETVNGKSIQASVSIFVQMLPQ